MKKARLLAGPCFVLCLLLVYSIAWGNYAKYFGGSKVRCYWGLSDAGGWRGLTGFAEVRFCGRVEMTRRFAGLRGGVWIVFLAGAAGGMFGQGVRRVPRPPLDRVTRAGCPAAVPPVASDSGATATDFVELWRKPCGQECAAYRVRVGGDGRVSWVGEDGVETMGAAAGTIDTIEARALIQRAADRGFWGLCGRYARTAVDGPTVVTTLSIAGYQKLVEDNGNGAPAWLTAFDVDVDQTLDTHRWRHGGPDVETFGLDRLNVDVGAPKVGVTRLMRVAAGRDMKELGEMLADSSLDLNATDSSGWNALMYASQAGSLEAVGMLLQARADPLRRSNAGESAMFAAASSSVRGLAKARALKAVGVNVNGQDRRGVTPLMIAAESFQVPGLVAGMIALGGDPAKRDVDGRTALDYLEEEERRAPDVSYGAVRGLLVVR